MARFGRRRKSFRSGRVKLNTKGGLPTSVSIGGKNQRLNIGRQTRITTRIPGTSVRTTHTLRSGRRSKSGRAATAPVTRQRGCLGGCSPGVLLIVILGAVLLIAMSRS
jgi:hypothetical protein